MQFLLLAKRSLARTCRRLILVCLGLAGVQFQCPGFQGSVVLGQAPGEQSDSEIASSIRKLFSDRCFTCHGPDSQTRATELRLDRDDGVQFDTSSGKKFAVAGNLSESEVWERIQSTDPDVVMPPPSSKI